MKKKLLGLGLLALSFSANLSAQINPALSSYVVTKDSEWKYLDNGTSLDGTNWNTLAFDNQTWSQGIAPLGYGDPMNTVVSFGPDSGNKHITTYYSKDITIDLATLTDNIQFGLRRDDGAIVYINGVELYRDNMPAGAVTYLTNSSAIIDGANEKLFYTAVFSKTIFQDGVNRISVEVHNRDGQSSDLGFDLFVRNIDESLNIDCATATGIGCFTSIQPTSQTPQLIIPQEHRFQLLAKQGQAHTVGVGSYEGNFDFTGYVPIANSSELGYLSINHENSPGGVSITDIHFDTTTKLWVRDNSQTVDMYNNDLVSTVRNCSGGVTPWGTIITAEENTSAGDANVDGYEDIGWLVEIDPVTKQVKEYGNNKQEKLWAMGRMNHENVVIADDLVTAYYGEDGGTNCVYKFVADNPGDLSSGTVYVLKLDLALSNDEPSSSTGTWIQVPNTTPADCNNIRTVAAALGGTNFNGVEDCEISPIDGRIYFTSKGKDRVYSFKDNGNTLSEFETFVGGMSYPIETSSGSVTTPWSDGNDNLTFDNKGNLWVQQDGGNNYIWVVRPNHTQSSPKVLLFASMPAGSEPTGLTFTPDFKYGFFSVQHPSGSNTPQPDATTNNVTFNASSAVVFALSENLGSQVLSSNNPNNTLGDTVKIYPNPTNGILNLSFKIEANQNYKVEVLDVLGRTIAQTIAGQTTGSLQKLTFDLTDLSANQIVIIKTTIGSKTGTYKVIKAN